MRRGSALSSPGALCTIQGQVRMTQPKRTPVLSAPGEWQSSRLQAALCRWSPAPPLGPLYLLRPPSSHSLEIDPAGTATGGALGS